MKKSKVMALKNSALEKKEKASDLDVLVQELMKLPHGQL